MHVGGVIVVVFDRVVSMGMRMLADNRGLMHVVVVPVVMPMRVVMFKGVMRMRVLVALGRVKQHAEAEQHGSSDTPGSEGSVAHPPCQRRTDERSHCENRPRARGADAPLS